MSLHAFDGAAQPIHTMQSALSSKGWASAPPKCPWHAERHTSGALVAFAVVFFLLKDDASEDALSRSSRAPKKSLAAPLPSRAHFPADLLSLAPARKVAPMTQQTAPHHNFLQKTLVPLT